MICQSMRRVRLFASILFGAFLAIWCLAILDAPAVARDSRILEAERQQLSAKIEQTAAEYPGLASDPHFKHVMKAMGSVDRANFVLPKFRTKAYRTEALPIGYDQTISDPYIVAIMTATTGVEKGSHVLEVGTGSGFQAAILAALGATVHSIEIVAPLAKSAARRLHRLGYSNVSVKAGDGFEGWSEFAPYDAIIVTAGASEVPAALLAQLRIGGKLVMPIGAQGPLEQLLLVTKREGGAFGRCSLGPSMFVPLTGRGERPAMLKGVYDRTIPLCYAGQRADWP